MEITTKGAEMFTKGQRYAFSTKGVGHGYCNAEFWGADDKGRLYFQPFNNRNEKVGSLVQILPTEIDEVEER